jgi:DNA-binding XRE family transcriptional regulator
LSEKKLEIKNNLSKYRLWKNQTQAGLARELNISVTQLRLIENSYKYPKYQVRAKICDYFNVNHNQMFFET